jgi:3-mercaptopyruvate sulfurtransferase SseA
VKRGFHLSIISIALIGMILLGSEQASSFPPRLRAENSAPTSPSPSPMAVPKKPKKFLDVPRIKPEALKKLIEMKMDVVIVDTQDEMIYRTTHIKGAINFPWGPVIKSPINLPRNKTLVIYCGCTDQEASLDVATQLVRDYGFKDIKILEGGFQQWLKLGYPIEKSGRK